MKRTNTKGISEEPFFKVLFSDDLWKEFKKYMFPKQKSSNYYDYENGDLAAKYGYLTLIKERKYFNFTSYGLTFAAMNGHYEVVKWLLDNVTSMYLLNNYLPVHFAAINGHLEILKLLHERIYRKRLNTDTFGMNTMDDVAANGHFEVIKYLYLVKRYECSRHTIDKAATGGHIEIVELLHKNGEHSSDCALAMSIANGHLEVVKYLCNNSYHKFWIERVLEAVDKNHYELVKFLYDNLEKKCMSNFRTNSVKITYNRIKEYLESCPSQ